MLHHWIATLLATLSLLGWGTEAHALIIDNFDDTSPYRLQIVTGTASDTRVPDGSGFALGGERDLLVSAGGGGFGFVRGGIPDVGTGTSIGAFRFEVLGGLTKTGGFELQWDGVDMSANSPPNTSPVTGLGLDLTFIDGVAGIGVGGKFFELVYNSTTGIALNLALYDTSARTATASFSLAATGNDFGTFLYALSDLMFASGFDVTSVAAIVLGAVNQPSGTDFTLTRFSIVPEPSSFGLLMTGTLAIVAGHVRRRSRRKFVSRAGTG
jgi:hypothetical protein